MKLQNGLFTMSSARFSRLKKVDFHKVAYSILQILQHKLQLNEQNVQKIFIATWQTSPNTLAKQ